jgi:hypothetical protein
MSRGSRATQVKPEALVILSRATPESASLIAGERRSVFACDEFWVSARKSPFRAPMTELLRNPRTGAQYGAESALR